MLQACKQHDETKTLPAPGSADDGRRLRISQAWENVDGETKARRSQGFAWENVDGERKVRRAQGFAWENVDGERKVRRAQGFARENADDERKVTWYCAWENVAHGAKQRKHVRECT